MQPHPCVLRIALIFVANFAASAGVIWYNGDFDGVDGTIAVNHGFGFLDVDSFVYDDFALGSDTALTGVFGYFLANGATPAGADYEIRSGVSLHNGGALVSSGFTGSISWTDTGGVFDSPVSGTLGVFRLDVSGLNVPLAAGVYWLGLRPVATVSDPTDAYLAQTNGANAIGLPGGDNGNSFVDSSFLGLAFEPMDANSDIDFSLGVATDVSTVPEPSSLLLLAAAGAILFRSKNRMPHASGQR